MKEEARRKVEELAAAICERYGCELFLIDFVDAGRHSLLRVTIDREDGGVSLDDCAKVSEALSVVLDVEDPVPHGYRLEVSSPGLDRPLRGERDFERYVGRKVKIVTHHAVGRGQTTFVGTLVGYADRTATLNTRGGEVRIAQDEIKRANIEYEP
jgi:ribosome maturation factor RimP